MTQPRTAKGLRREFKKQEIDGMLGMDVIDLAQKEWAFLIVFFLEKDVTLHICFKQFMLNAVKIWYRYPTQEMDQLID